MPRSHPRACRCLFGRPEPGEVDKFLKEAEELYLHDAERRWNFDFRAGRPLTDVNNQHYEWLPVENHKTMASAHGNASESMKQ